MSWIIENEVLTARFNEQGGELASLKAKESGVEYIWQGDPAFWGRHAPVLFPFVGSLKDDQYRHQGQTYQMGQHGFARDQQFSLKARTTDSVSLSLKSSAETKKVYPFDFELILHYHLEGNKLTCGYEVINQGTDNMLFSIGGHPAFNVPLDGEGTFEDYFLQFSPRKSRVQLPLNGRFIDGANKTLGQTNTDIALTRELFNMDALIYETSGAHSYAIKSEKTSHSVTVTYDNLPYVGIWSPYPKEAPFVCIEPWDGIADTVDATGELAEKMGIKSLDSQGVYRNSFAIVID